MKKNSYFFPLGVLFLGLLLTSCSKFTSRRASTPLPPPEPIVIKGDESMPPPAEVPTAPLANQEWLKSSGDGVYKIGKPYKVNGIWYFPSENYKYDEIGYASWYGSNFHNKRTANGEIFDKDALTGAHKTLPLPSIVRATNLDNNKSVILRINDRGPFVNNRILDVSEKASKLLEFPEQGFARVRVEVLPEESKEAATMTQGNLSVPFHPLTTGEVSASSSLPFSPESQSPVSPTDNPGLTSSVDSSSERGTLNSAAPPSEESLFDAAPVTEAPLDSGDSSSGSSPHSPAEVISGESASASSEPTPIVVPEKSFYVQAGTFSKVENATNLTAKLSSVGPSTATPITVKGQTFHRVQVGPFSTEQEASAALTQVQAQGLPDARLLKS